MKKIKILHIQVLPKLSGVQKVSLDLLTKLSNDTYDKHIVFGSGCNIDDNLISKLGSANVKVTFINSLRRSIGFHDFLAAYELYKYIRKNKFDIVHTNSSKPSIVGRIAAYFAKTELIVHTVHGISFHDFEPLLRRTIYRFIDNYFCRFGDVLISVNEHYLKLFPSADHKVCVHNGVELADFENVPYSKKDESFFNLGFMSRLDKQKDPLTLLRAIKYLSVNGLIVSDDFKLHIGGAGELEDEVSSYICNNDLDEFVIDYGWISDQDEFFDKIDVFCLPSIYEAFGLVILEAARNNIPTIGSNVEGIPEVIVPNKTGYLFEAKNHIELAIYILHYYKNNQLAIQHGKAAKERLVKEFSLEKMVGKYEEIYRFKDK